MELRKIKKNKIKVKEIDRELHDEIFHLQEDMCEYIADEYFAGNSGLTAKTYWKIVECIALAKQAELNGFINN